MLLDVITKARSLYNTGQYSQGIIWLLSNGEFSEDSQYNYYLGLCYIKENDYENGINHLALSLEEDKDLLRVFQSNILIAYSYIMQEDYKSALKTLNDLLDSGYESAKLHSLLGYVYHKKAMTSKSIRNYRRALELDPDNANALNSLGYILSEFPDELNEAENMCRKALKFNANNPAYLDSLGWVALKKQNYTGAGVFLKKALDLAPKSTEIKKHLSLYEKLRVKK